MAGAAMVDLKHEHALGTRGSQNLQLHMQEVGQNSTLTVLICNSS
jgi:hypothetical protein